MRGLLVRVGVDQGKDNGQFNAPVDGLTRKFCYVPIPEKPNREIRPGMERSYINVNKALSRFHVQLPVHLEQRKMHLDPDFEYLTYGDENCKGCRIYNMWNDSERLDFLVFYAALKDVIDKNGPLIYAIVGFYWIEEIMKAAKVLPDRHDENAHTRCIRLGDHEIIVRAKRKKSGRLKKCIPIGSYRPDCNNPQGRYQYRVERELLKEWGGLSVKDGWLQRSAYIPEFENAKRFLEWFRPYEQNLIPRNN